MSRLGVLYADETSDKISAYWLQCPGCGHPHRIPADGKWEVKGTLEKPSIIPSVFARYERYGEQCTCHFFVHRGKIYFLRECTHAFKMKIVEMEELGPLEIREQDTEVSAQHPLVQVVQQLQERRER